MKAGESLIRAAQEYSGRHSGARHAVQLACPAYGDVFRRRGRRVSPARLACFADVSGVISRRIKAPGVNTPDYYVLGGHHERTPELTVIQ